MKNKLKLAVDYQYLLYKTLEMCIWKMEMKDVEFYRHSAISYFIALALFRIPAFKEVCMNLIKKKGFVEVEEWREFTHEDPEPQKHQNAIGHLFDWDQHFYEHVPAGSIKDECEKMMKSILFQKQW